MFCYIYITALRYSDKQDFTAYIIQSTSQGILLKKREKFIFFFFAVQPNPHSILVLLPIRAQITKT